MRKLSSVQQRNENRNNRNEEKKAAMQHSHVLFTVRDEMK